MSVSSIIIIQYAHMGRLNFMGDYYSGTPLLGQREVVLIRGVVLLEGLKSH